MRSVITIGEVSELRAPLKYFRPWLRNEKPSAFDLPTRQELVLLGVAFFFAPLVIAFASIWIFFQEEFAELHGRERVLFLLAVPFLLPAAYCYVVVHDMMRPLAMRILLRRRLLREAKKAVRELMAGLP
ncbi:MAG: hypothetical protein WBB32_06500 [Flavobacteriales bacterium]